MNIFSDDTVRKFLKDNVGRKVGQHPLTNIGVELTTTTITYNANQSCLMMYNLDTDETTIVQQNQLIGDTKSFLVGGKVGIAA